MKKTLILAGAALAMVLGASAYADKMAIGIVNMQKVYSSVIGGQQFRTKMEKKFASQQARISSMAKKLQAEQKDIEKNKAVMSKTQLTQKQEELRKEQNSFQIAQAKYQQSVMAAQQQAVKSLIQNLKNASRDVAMSDNLNAVFSDQVVLYARNSKDVTAEVLDKMPKE